MWWNFKKNNKKVGLWNITGKIIKVFSGGSYKIKIISDENNILSQNDILKKIDDNLWIELNKEYQENLNKHIENIYGKNNNNEEYNYSSENNSQISNSDFGMSEDENLYKKKIKK